MASTYIPSYSSHKSSTATKLTSVLSSNKHPFLFLPLSTTSHSTAVEAWFQDLDVEQTISLSPKDGSTNKNGLYVFFNERESAVRAMRVVKMRAGSGGSVEGMEVREPGDEVEKVRLALHGFKEVESDSCLGRDNSEERLG
jgi:hypothetical protein